MTLLFSMRALVCEWCVMLQFQSGLRTWPSFAVMVQVTSNLIRSWGSGMRSQIWTGLQMWMTVKGPDGLVFFGGATTGLRLKWRRSRRQPRTVVLISLKLSVVILWSEMHPVGSDNTRNLRWSCFLTGFYCRSSLTSGLTGGGTIWICSRRQGLSIWGGVLAFRGSDWLDRVQEVGLMLLSHCFGGPLLGDFSSVCGFLSAGSRSGFIFSVEGSQVELSVWP